MPMNLDTKHVARLKEHYCRHRTLPSMQRIADLLGMFRSYGR